MSSLVAWLPLLTKLAVYGLGVDFGVVLAAMGLVSVGNPLSLNPGFSIGGETDKSSNILDNLGGLLGKSL